MRIGILDPVHPIIEQRLNAAGHSCTPLHALSDSAREQELAATEGLVVRSRRINAAAIDRSARLRFIARVGAGLENIDMAHCARKGILVLNSPEGNRDGVGETCVLLLLALMKHLVPANRAVHNGEWPREAMRGNDLHDKTVGIIGYGNMGSAFAEKLRGFGVRILGHDKYRSGFTTTGVEEASLEQTLAESDVISLHLPLNPGTAHYANSAFFNRLKRPVWFLNTSRGGVVHTTALLDAMDSGRVIGAGLDVLEYERPELDGLAPGPDRPTYDRLLRHDRVILTPHIAGVTHEGKFKMADVLATKILQHFPNGTT